jgi:hypothetical protein
LFRLILGCPSRLDLESIRLLISTVGPLEAGDRRLSLGTGRIASTAMIDGRPKRTAKHSLG